MNHNREIFLIGMILAESEGFQKGMPKHSKRYRAWQRIMDDAAQLCLCYDFDVNSTEMYAMVNKAVDALNAATGGE